MAGRDDEKTSEFVKSKISVKEFIPPVFKKARANQVAHLQSNLNRLKDLHSRLRFMIKELEDLVQK